MTFRFFNFIDFPKLVQILAAPDCDSSGLFGKTVIFTAGTSNKLLVNRDTRVGITFSFRVVT